MTRARPLPTAASRDRLLTGLAALELRLPESASSQLEAFLDELLRWNAAYNLTSVRDPAEMVTRHLLDSLVVLPLLDEWLAGKPSPTLLDVGAGAGLPCIPLAIARPEWQVTGLDSNGKKARFMRHAGRSLGLAQFKVIEGRAEDVEENEAPFDVITSRAFSSLGEFFAHTDHRLKPDGFWLAMKARIAPEELLNLPPNVQLRPALPLSVPGLFEARHALIARLKPLV